MVKPEENATAVPSKATGWRTVVHNDPVNLMGYVQWVFESYFTMDVETAYKCMLRVHHRGRAIVSHGSREAMEKDATAMHTYGLRATIEEDEQ
ncbi:ATP-dependent Clp protease adapter ClpS [Arcanobacterium wilhelmae]|nr:ATP-dependent Clp protease adapter ClpS [Arcanobacterium wilhelmae]WFN91131.1 ATP-dependent Clp protease adapter ClpS [Arcanobacterium wilhelmae]